MVIAGLLWSDAEKTRAAVSRGEALRCLQVTVRSISHVCHVELFPSLATSSSPHDLPGGRREPQLSSDLHRSAMERTHACTHIHRHNEWNKDRRNIRKLQQWANHSEMYTSVLRDLQSFIWIIPVENEAL